MFILFAIGKKSNAEGSVKAVPFHGPCVMQGNPLGTDYILNTITGQF